MGGFRQVLQDSLCGSSKVLLVCCLSPEPGSAGETLSSLNFAQRAAQVELGPARKASGEGAKTGGAPATPAARRRACNALAPFLCMLEERPP